ncbi:MAG: HAD family phosphatase [Candidatus Bathyarchaeota archaeon]|nr:HAD family phosphatase [Candidatus Bathyarchaeota archaeon]
MIDIRSLILDYGGVISYPQKQEFYDKVYQILAQKPDKLKEFYYQFRPDFDIGKLSAEEYWIKIFDNLGVQYDKINLQTLITMDLQSWTIENPAMNRFIIENRDKVHNLSIISNMPREFACYLRDNYSLLNYFDEIIFSGEIGLIKPDQRIFEYTLEKLGIPPNECLFVDDSKTNIAAAEKKGINTIHFTTFTQFRDELNSKYILVGS